MLFYVPKTYFLDINLDLADAQIGKLRTMPITAESSQHHQHGNRNGAGDNDDTGTDTNNDISRSDKSKNNDRFDVDDLRIRGHNAGETLRLKRERDLDVDNARSEWRVGERRVVVWV